MVSIRGSAGFGGYGFISMKTSGVHPQTPGRHPCDFRSFYFGWVDRFRAGLRYLVGYLLFYGGWTFWDLFRVYVWSGFHSPRSTRRNRPSTVRAGATYRRQRGPYTWTP